MSSSLLFFYIALLLVACSSKEYSKEGGRAAADPNAGTTGTESLAQAPKEELRGAMRSMLEVTSYHAEAALKIGDKDVTLAGNFAPSSVHLMIHRADGKLVHGVAVGDRAAVSEDDGATWQRDDGSNTRNLSMLVTEPLKHGLEIPDQGEVTFQGEEEVDGVPSRHFHVATTNPIDIWICDGPGRKVVRKLKTVVEATDVTVDATILFSNWNVPVGIEMPAGAP